MGERGSNKKDNQPRIKNNVELVFASDRENGSHDCFANGVDDDDGIADVSNSLPTSA